ncbi:MAG: MFS transporter [Streptosporangiales bacterium]
MADEYAAPRGDDDIAAPDKSTLRRAIAGSAMGNATEWYDYGSYAYVASAIGANFFPGDDPTLQTLSAFGVFAVSFAVRPFGGIVFGPLGDRLGRQKILALTIILMASCTFLLGVVPGYDTIGVAAPIILVFLRMVQGFSTGGEYGGAATFMAEYAPNRRRGFLGSFLEFGTLSGYLLAIVITTVVSFLIGPDAMQAWGWRIPFLVAAPLGAVGLYMRLKLEDTPVFRELEESGQKETSTATQWADIFRQWRPLLVCGGMVIMLNVTDYTLLTYMPTYLGDTIHLSSSTALLITACVYAGMMCVINLAGRWSDHIGRKPLWYISGVGFLVLSIPAFLVMRINIGWAVVGFLVLGLLLVLQLSTISATFPALFPTHVRYAGFALAYNISTAAFGGTVPLIDKYVVAEHGITLWPAYYMMGACVVGIIAVWRAPETARASLRGTEVPDIKKQEAAPSPG